MEKPADEFRTSPVPVLQAVNQTDGTRYYRPAPIEAAIQVAKELSRETVLARAKIRNTDAPGYVPSEVLVHLLRASTDDKSDTFFDALYQLIIQRIEALCPVPSRRTQDGGDSAASTALFVRETVVGQVNEYIARDREGYCEKLDFFEVRFNQAIARRRSTAKRTIARREARTDSMDAPSLSRGMDEKFERALAAAYQARSAKADTDFFRFKVAPAIDQLPEKERIVINLMLQGIQSETKDLTKPSISKMLGLTDRAVRYRHSSAIKKLKALIADQGAS
ncbi:sigma factor-like helix-turn-helix DNA-binding protein [Hyphomonas sp.]|uniref:sigma factor-like helix-turn-helix DNA-binding protein n=1 Tax=Hyphomonas sp. TaxID=87 RepID=UPI0025C16FB5|nr:sigma factor-like helix-turn-helix DNA-binding protein [Hyphomonas sp.]